MGVITMVNDLGVTMLMPVPMMPMLMVIMPVMVMLMRVGVQMVSALLLLLQLLLCSRFQPGLVHLNINGVLRAACVALPHV